MTKKVRIWLDTGVNIHSAFKDEMDEDEFGMTEEEWGAMDMDEQFQYVLDMCYGFDWGVSFEDEESPVEE